MLKHKHLAFIIVCLVFVISVIYLSTNELERDSIGKITGTSFLIILVCVISGIGSLFPIGIYFEKNWDKPINYKIRRR